MGVVGDNIANVNTTGYKKGAVEFQELLSQQISGASAPRAVRIPCRPSVRPMRALARSISRANTMVAPSVSARLPRKTGIATPVLTRAGGSQPS